MLKYINLVHVPSETDMGIYVIDNEGRLFDGCLNYIGATVTEVEGLRARSYIAFPVAMPGEPFNPWARLYGDLVSPQVEAMLGAGQ